MDLASILIPPEEVSDDDDLDELQSNFGSASDEERERTDGDANNGLHAVVMQPIGRRDVAKIIRAMNSEGPGDGSRLDALLGFFESSLATVYHSQAETALRWLLKAMNPPLAPPRSGSSTFHFASTSELLRRAPVTWKLLRLFFKSMPAGVLSKALSDRKFLDVLRNTLKQLVEEEPSHQISDQVPDQISESSSTLGKRKRTDGEDDAEFDLLSLRSPEGQHKTLQAFFDAMWVLLGRTEDAGPARSTRSIQAPANHIRAYFRQLNAHLAAPLTRMMFEACLKCKPGPDRDDQETSLLLWPQVARAFWNKRFPSDRDSIQVATHVVATVCRLMTMIKEDSLWLKDIGDSWSKRTLAPFLRDELLGQPAINIEGLNIVTEIIRPSIVSAAPILYEAACDSLMTLPRNDARSWLQKVFCILERGLRDVADIYQRTWALKLMVRMEGTKNVLEPADLRRVCKYSIIDQEWTSWSLVQALLWHDTTMFSSNDGKGMLTDILWRLQSSEANLAVGDLDAARTAMSLVGQGYSISRTIFDFYKLWHIQMSASYIQPTAHSDRVSIWFKMFPPYEEAMYESWFKPGQHELPIRQFNKFLAWLKRSAPGKSPAATIKVLLKIVEEIRCFTTHLPESERPDCIDASANILELMQPLISSQDLPTYIKCLKWDILRSLSMWRKCVWGQSYAHCIWVSPIKEELLRVLRDNDVEDDETYSAFLCCMVAWVSERQSSQYTSENDLEIGTAMVSTLQRVHEALHSFDCPDIEKLDMLSHDEVYKPDTKKTKLSKFFRYTSINRSDGADPVSFCGPQYFPLNSAMAIRGTLAEFSSCRGTAMLKALIFRSCGLDSPYSGEEAGDIVRGCLEVMVATPQQGVCLDQEDAKTLPQEPFEAMRVLSWISMGTLTPPLERALSQALMRQFQFMETQHMEGNVTWDPEQWILFLEMFRIMMSRINFHVTFGIVVRIGSMLGSLSTACGHSKLLSRKVEDTNSLYAMLLEKWFTRANYDYTNSIRQGFLEEFRTLITGFGIRQTVPAALRLRILHALRSNWRNYKRIIEDIPLTRIHQTINSLVNELIKDFFDDPLKVYQANIGLMSLVFDIVMQLPPISIVNLKWRNWEQKMKDLDEGLLIKWKARTFIIITLPGRKLDEEDWPVNFGLVEGRKENPESVWGQRTYISKCIEALLKSFTNRWEEEHYFRKLLEALGRCESEEGQSRQLFALDHTVDVMVVVPQVENHDRPGLFPRLHDHITRRLRVTKSVVEAGALIDMLRTIHDYRSTTLGQAQVESGVAAINAICQHEHIALQIYDKLTKFLKSLITKIRFRLDDRSGELVTVFATLLRINLKYAALPGVDVNLNARFDNTKAFTDVLVSLCEPPSNTVQQHGLSSGVDEARARAGRIGWSVIVSFVTLALELGSVPADMQATLQIGWNAVFRAIKPINRRQSQSMLAQEARYIAGSLWTNYKMVKYRGE